MFIVVISKHSFLWKHFLIIFCVENAKQIYFLDLFSFNFHHTPTQYFFFTFLTKDVPELTQNKYYIEHEFCNNVTTLSYVFFFLNKNVFSSHSLRWYMSWKIEKRKYFSFWRIWMDRDMILTTIGDFYISVTYDVFCVTPKWFLCV